MCIACWLHEHAHLACAICAQHVLLLCCTAALTHAWLASPLQGLRKPALEAYQLAATTLQVEPARVVFVDDRQANVDGARAAGMQGVRFQSAAQLEQALLQLGLRF